MSPETSNHAWELWTELRKEIIASQQIRSQVIGFKITFVSTAIAVILANIDKVPIQLLIIPAFASVFFDLLINSYGFSIKRLGLYCRELEEKILHPAWNWPQEIMGWEKFLEHPKYRQGSGSWGNVGLTILTCAIATIALANKFELYISCPLLGALAVAIYVDFRMAGRTHSLRFEGCPVEPNWFQKLQARVKWTRSLSRGSKQ